MGPFRGHRSVWTTSIDVENVTMSLSPPERLSTGDISDCTSNKESVPSIMNAKVIGVAVSRQSGRTLLNESAKCHSRSFLSYI
jgi:hypothetical protein